MPFCPKCRCEYREGFTYCPDCECDLVDSLPVPEAARGAQSEGLVQEDFTWLANVEDGPLGEGAIAVLRAYEIPYRTGYSDQGMIGGLYTGKSTTGIDVYVPNSRLQEARELLNEATFDMSEAMRLTYIVEKDTEKYKDEIKEILEEYWSTSFIPVQECFECPGETITLYGQDMVLAVIRLCDNGRLGVFVNPDPMDQDIFDAAFAEAEKAARERGIARLWCELPRDEATIVGQYMKHGFTGRDTGAAVDFWGQEVDMLSFERSMQDATE